MYRLKCKVGKTYRIGLQTYGTLEAAKSRCGELKKVGIKSKIVLEDKLFN